MRTTMHPARLYVCVVCVSVTCQQRLGGEAIINALDKQAGIALLQHTGHLRSSCHVSVKRSSRLCGIADRRGELVQRLLCKIRVDQADLTTAMPVGAEAVMQELDLDHAQPRPAVEFFIETQPLGN